MRKILIASFALVSLGACVVRPRPAVRPARTVVVVKRCPVGYHWNGHHCRHN